MTSDSRLESTIDKILNQSKIELSESLKNSLEEAQNTVSNSQTSLEQEFDRIRDEGKKEAEKIEKQLIGSSDLEARNKQILLIEDAVERVFEKAIKQISNTKRDDNYSKLLSALINESVKALGTSDVSISTNSQDKEIVNSLLSQFSGAELSGNAIECLGGVQVKSKDGTMTFVNTLDARLERMKPLIRKEIASKFNIGV